MYEYDKDEGFGPVNPVRLEDAEPIIPVSVEPASIDPAAAIEPAAVGPAVVEPAEVEAVSPVGSIFVEPATVAPVVSGPTQAWEPAMAENARPAGASDDQAVRQGQRFASPFTPSPQPQPEPRPEPQPEIRQPQPEAQSRPQAYERQPYQPGMPPPGVQPYTQQAGTQQPYVQPYTQQAPYGQQYSQTPPGQAYGASPYSQFAQGQPGQPAEKPKRKKEKKHREGPGGLGIGRRNTAILVLIIILACAASGIGGGMIGANMNASEPVAVSSGGPAITIEPSNDITTTEAVAKKVLSSVVGITSTGKYVSNNFFFGPSEEEITGVGTGMIIDTKGYILTNSHVVMDGSVDSIKVLLSGGEEVDGKVIWNDAGLDLAIVKVNATGLIPVELGDSDAVAIGSYVAAIGNPLGLEFSGSITSGVVSGLDRTIEVSDGMGGATVTMQDLIQVDAAINSGNSGGPLLNSRGQVIGINTAKASAEGMGFAIPINTAIPIVEKVLKEGSFERVFMGVSAADVSVIRENYPNVELKAESGACITDVNPGSPAEKGGLKVKDVITAVDGKEVSGSNSLIKMLLGYTSGETIKVTFNRDGEVMETDVTLLSQSELEKAQQAENPFKEPDRGNRGR